MSDRSDQTMDSRDPFGDNWIRVSIVAGFIATFAMTATLTAGYLFANAVGDAEGSQLARWLYALSENRMADQVSDAFAIGMVLNLIVGLVWALIYARFAEPALSGPGYVEGMLFSLVPFVLSVLIVFPVLDGGFLGSNLGAGPLPVIGNLILHLVYGAVLGAMYALEEAHGTSANSREHEAAASSERGSAIGVVAGGLVGAVAGFIVAPGIEDLASRPVITLAGILTGGAIGMLIGSLVGITAMDEDEAEVRSDPAARRTRI